MNKTYDNNQHYQMSLLIMGILFSMLFSRIVFDLIYLAHADPTKKLDDIIIEHLLADRN